MGNELKCTVRFGKETSEGKALLETSEMLFRGEFSAEDSVCFDQVGEGG